MNSGVSKSRATRNEVLDLDPCQRVLVFLLCLTLRSSNEQIRFTIVNADTGEIVTNVDVTAYRPKPPLLKEVSEYMDRSPVSADEKTYEECKEVGERVTQRRVDVAAGLSWGADPRCNSETRRMFAQTEDLTFVGALRLFDLASSLWRRNEQ